MTTSLRAFAQFVGKPNSPISPRALVKDLSLNFPSSLSVRELIKVFDGFSEPVALEALSVEPNNRIVPFEVGMQVTKIKGHPLGVRWRIVRGGQHVAVYEVSRIGASMPQAAHTFTEPGTYTVEATIKAIGSTGYAEATKSVQVIAQPKAQPMPLQKPTIAVTANQSNGMPNGAFTVTGSGFLPNTTVNIRVVDAALTTAFFTQSSSAQGTLNFVSGKLCQLPGKLFFSANDGRSDRNDLTGTLWSNTVEMTCS
jgi:hypothetical protein